MPKSQERRGRFAVGTTVKFKIRHRWAIGKITGFRTERGTEYADIFGGKDGKSAFHTVPLNALVKPRNQETK